MAALELCWEAEWRQLLLSSDTSQRLQQMNKAAEEGTSSLFAASLHLRLIGAGGLLLLALALQSTRKDTHSVSWL